MRRPPHVGVLDIRVVGCPVPPDQRAVDAITVDAQGATVLRLPLAAGHDAVHLGEERARGPGGRDPQRERLLPCERARGQGGVEGAITVGMELVDDVGTGVEPVLEGGIGTQGAHDAAVAGVLDEMGLDAQQATERWALQPDAP